MTDSDVFGPGPREAFPGNAEQQVLSDADHGASDSDQTNADYDQTFSDIDQSASERDQRASDRDQRAADRGQALADQSVRGSHASRWSDTRRSRSQSSVDRDISERARREGAIARDAVARRRDMDAGTRDARAQRRDELAAALDAEMEALERADTAGVNGSPPQLALRARRRAAAARESSARARAAAAEDRAAAYADRVRAAEDREAAAQGELALERLDHLTGALRHDYFIARLGGDEFGCVLYQQTQSDLSERFAQIAAEVAERHDGARITVGFADARNEDRPEQLIARAEAAMNAARRERAAASQRQSGGEAG